MTGAPLVVGHRGDVRHAPENTLAAFRHCVTLGCDGIECDVQLTRDGEPVLLHDATLNRTTSGRGRLADRDWHAVRALDAGAGHGAGHAGQRVPHLNELLAATPRGFRLFLELKADPDRDTTNPADAAIRAVRGANREADVVFLSFRLDWLALARARAPAIPCGWNVSRCPPDKALPDWLAAVSMPLDHCRPPTAERIHARGMRLYLWGLRTPRAVRTALRRAPAVLIADDPADALAARQAQRR